jgi:molecular chaperone DnaJ
MGAVNPYRILGVPPNATGGEIRRAYHTLALQVHPDAGGESGERFVEIHEAYRLLSDPASRADYDRGHQPYSERRHQREFGLPFTMGSLRDDVDELMRGAFELMNLVGGGFVHEGMAHPEHESLHYDLRLTREEAARGGRFDFTIPLRRHCRRCDVSGRFACAECGGEGFVTEEREIGVLVPPGVCDGARAELALGRLGLEGGIVDVTVRID